MAKRKGGFKDTIYELENDDIEISSDDEAKESKKGRFVDKSKGLSVNKNLGDLNSMNEVISLDSSEEVVGENEISNQTNNGGKTSSKTTLKRKAIEKLNLKHKKQPETVCEKGGNDLSHTVIHYEDITVDSPTSNSDLGVVGCENRTPLITVTFKDSKLAFVLKKTIKDFLINLLKSHEGKVSDEGESDNVLDIWPEDLFDEDCNKEDNKQDDDDGLFFVDTTPGDDKHIDIPKYSQNATVICNPPEEEQTPSTIIKRKQTCFNCDGEHQLRDCPLPRDNYKIAERRKAIGVKVGRYHVEDDQKYGHLVPGRISASLRSALGLKRYELPLYIYRMRLLGYPPGWLEEARISHSGITMFDSTGNAIMDPDEEEGEVFEPGSKDKFDIKKILDFPGFNVPASSRYVEEAHLYGLPPISEQDSKMSMLQTLAPNAVKAYKRKKLLFFPSSNNNSLQGQAEMELDSGDEVAEFPSVPPLPDEAPPPAPPPPPPPPSLPMEESNTPDKSKNLNETSNKIDCKNTNKIDLTKKNKHLNIELTDTDGSSDVEVIEVIQVDEIPVPEDDLITIDEDYSSLSQVSSGRVSPSLDDLENKKRILLDALKSDISQSDKIIELSESIETIENESLNTEITEDDIEEMLDSAIKIDNNAVVDNKNVESKQDVTSMDVTVKKSAHSLEHVILEENKEKEFALECTEDKNISNESNSHEKIIVNDKETSKSNAEVTKIAEIDTVENDSEIHSNEETTGSMSSILQASSSDTTKTDKAGNVKTTLYGTPVINVASSYSKLPTEDKFAKDICDVIYFENLPNSTGKYKKISNLLKKVKTVVDRIQES